MAFNGDEFACMEYLAAGYDGFMTGGAIISAVFLRRMSVAYISGQKETAVEIDREMHALLLSVYGGKTIGCWLTGLKYALVKLGIFSGTASYLQYPLTAECRAAIDRIVNSDGEEALGAVLGNA